MKSFLAQRDLSLTAKSSGATMQHEGKQLSISTAPLLFPDVLLEVPATSDRPATMERGPQPLQI